MFAADGHGRGRAGVARGAGGVVRARPRAAALAGRAGHRLVIRRDPRHQCVPS